MLKYLHLIPFLALSQMDSPAQPCRAASGAVLQQGPMEFHPSAYRHTWKSCMCSVSLSCSASPPEGTDRWCSASLAVAGDLCAMHDSWEGGIMGYKHEAGEQGICSNVFWSQTAIPDQTQKWKMWQTCTSQSSAELKLMHAPTRVGVSYPTWAVPTAAARQSLPPFSLLHTD